MCFVRFFRFWTRNPTLWCFSYSRMRFVWDFSALHCGCQWRVWIRAVTGGLCFFSVLWFLHPFFFHTFPDIITIRNYWFHAFLRNCPPRRDLTVGYTSLYFCGKRTSSISPCYILLHFSIVIWKHFGERQISPCYILSYISRKKWTCLRNTKNAEHTRWDAYSVIRADPIWASRRGSNLTVL